MEKPAAHAGMSPTRGPPLSKVKKVAGACLVQCGIEVRHVMSRLWSKEPKTHSNTTTPMYGHVFKMGCCSSRCGVRKQLLQRCKPKRVRSYNTMINLTVICLTVVPYELCERLEKEKVE